MSDVNNLETNKSGSFYFILRNEFQFVNIL